MKDKLSNGRRALERIASALETDMRNFFDEKLEASQHLQEVRTLLTAFDSITDSNERRACLEFVQEVAARQRAP